MTNAQKTDKKKDLMARAKNVAIGLVLGAVITTMPKWCSREPMQERIVEKERIVYKCEPDSGPLALPPDAGMPKPDVEVKKEPAKKPVRARPARKTEAFPAVKACDPKLVTDDRAFKYELAANSGLKSMASQLAGMSIHGTVDICIKERKITVSLKPGATADADLLRQAKRAIVEKVRAVGYPPLDMRFTFGMDNIRP